MSIEDTLGHVFQNKQLLQDALTHPGAAESAGGVSLNYQRLEFLGDAVLGLAVAELLFQLYPAESEGNLATRRSALVRSETLAGVAKALELQKYLRVAPGKPGGPSILEDTCEALLGALYLDGGFEAAKHFVVTHWEPLARATAAPPKDAKTALQEWAQGRGMKLPVYTVLETVGPAHAPEFTVEVILENGSRAQAKAASKRQAEQLAAKALLEGLHE